MSAVLIGPFAQILPLTGLSDKGPLSDDQLLVIKDGGIVVEGERIHSMGFFSELATRYTAQVHRITEPLVLLPGFVDAHTHMCFSGSRAADYALRMNGVDYLEIARCGGGILDTVKKTRAARKEELISSLLGRCDGRLKDGVTTCEVKSGYGLNVEDEVKMLAAIRHVHERHAIDLVSTCLAAHVKPPEFDDAKTYLNFVAGEILPRVKNEDLARRVDIFVEEGVFSVEEAREFARRTQAMGFVLTLHADQFSSGGVKLAVEVGAVSADHLEVSSEADIRTLAASNVAAVVLPGASLGLGVCFAPARKLLDAGCSVAIASDFNPGSAPMGDMLTQAAILGMALKLTTAEVFAGMTFRAAQALCLGDRGVLAKDFLADMAAFPCADYREILYHQGQLRPRFVWKRGRRFVV